MHTNFPTHLPSLFPIWALPPKMKASVEEVINITQAPPALVASSALAAASLATQAGYNVRRMNHLVNPCSLIVISIAESGERKSTVDHLFGSIFSEFESEQNAKLQLTLRKKRPTQRIQVIYNDATPAAFLRGLHQNSCCAGLWEDEAGRIFTSPLADDLGLLNKGWDGRNISINRRSGSFLVENPRVTISWMVQPSVFERYMARKGDNARGIGFLARGLVSYPQSTQGSRFIRSIPEKLPGIQAFRERTKQLLASQIETLLPQLEDEGDYDD